MNQFSVLVTRTDPEGRRLCSYLERYDFHALFCPTVKIENISSGCITEQIKLLDRYDWLIFTSRHAVSTFSPWIKERIPTFPFPSKIAAVGPGTAHALQDEQLPVHTYPDQEWGSEGLLKLAPFQSVAGKKIAIVCGENGRRLLEETLQARGAFVENIFCYRRVLASIEVSSYVSLLQQDAIHAIVGASSETLQQLLALFPKPVSSLLKKIPLVLVSERIMIQAEGLGFIECYRAENASHLSILKILQAIRKEKHVLSSRTK